MWLLCLKLDTVLRASTVFLRIFKGFVNTGYSEAQHNPPLKAKCPLSDNKIHIFQSSKMHISLSVKEENC